MSFTINKILLNLDAIGEELKKAREDKKISLEKASSETGINTKYLKALEEGNAEKLPIGVYGKSFLKEYSLFLGLDASALMETYSEENKTKEDEKNKNLFSKKIPKAHYFLSLPKIIKNSIIVFALIICLSYLGYCLKNVFSPPELSILNPKDNIIIEDNFIDISGHTEPGAEVVINGEPILIESDGSFNKELSLKYGLNTVSITAQKKYSRKSEQIKTIMVKEYN